MGVPGRANPGALPTALCFDGFRYAQEEHLQAKLKAASTMERRGAETVFFGNLRGALEGNMFSVLMRFH